VHPLPCNYDKKTLHKTKLKQSKNTMTTVRRNFVVKIFIFGPERVLGRQLCFMMIVTFEREKNMK
jgi:hypothetical protein